MKRRFLKGSSSSPASSSPTSGGDDKSPSTTPLRSSRSSSSLVKSPGLSKIPVALSSSMRGSPGAYGLKDTKRDSLGTATTASTVKERDEESVPPTPDLMSDFSDAGTQSSGPDSPPQTETKDDIFGSARARGQFGSGFGFRSGNAYGYGRGDFLDGVDESSQEDIVITPTHTPKSKTVSAASTTHMDKTLTPTTPPTKSTPKAQLGSLSIPSPSSPIAALPLSPSATCAKCGGALLSRKDGGRFVTVPEEPRSSGAEPKTYHTACFRCVVCGDVFKEGEGGKGKAVFVRGEGGACHVEVCSVCSISLIGGGN